MKENKKILGNWFKVGNCIDDSTGHFYGQGKQKQKRVCINGDSEICTAQDRERIVPCTNIKISKFADAKRSMQNDFI